MRRVCCSWLTNLKADFKLIPVYDICKAIATYGIVSIELPAVHMPKLHAADAGVLLANASDILKNKRFLSRLSKHLRLIMFIVSLLAYAKQCAKLLNLISFGVLCAQVAYCLAPAFFLIWMPNLASATLISSSYASDLIWAFSSSARSLFSSSCSA